jgi:uncharacterized protein YjbI with pentapeptide repeats
MIQNSKHIRLQQTTGQSTRDAMSQKAITDAIADTSIATVIDMKPGEYLSDIIQSITDATIDKQYTINFYNHSKTINWDTFTQKIHVPRFIHINFVGNIDWWPNIYYPRIGFDEGLTDVNPVDKLFIGFSFDRTNADDVTHISGLPTNLWKIFFGGLDQSYQIANDYQDLIDAPEDWGEAEFGLVRVNGSKDDDVRNDALYKKINGVFIDVTPEFKLVDFSGSYLQSAYFYSANCQSANFYSANCQSTDFNSANCKSASFDYVNCQLANFDYANCQSANFIAANCQFANFFAANCQGDNFYSANCQLANFSYANCQSADFNSANCQSADFFSANLRSVSWYNVVSIAGANFGNADLTGGIYLPERINTKAKWIAECGAGNVNAETLWIDGTSILD